MLVWVIEMKQQLFLGKSSFEELLPVLQRYEPKHIFLVRGKRSYELCGAKEMMNHFFAKLQCEITEFFDFEENPKIEDMKRGLALLSRSSASFIIAVGGGSVIDMAKLVRFFSSFSGDPTSNNFIKKRESIPLIAIPTTSGTGCETTHFAVLYKNKKKYSVTHNSILPDIAVIYPPFTYRNSTYLTACTGFDALAQAIESYWSTRATEESMDYAEKAIQLLWKNLPVAVNSPNENVRDKISEGAYWAGKAINIAKTTAPHALSYPFTSYYNIPHGHAVALTFPFVMSFNFNVSERNVHSSITVFDIRKRLDSLADMLNLSNKEGDVAFVLCNYIRGLGLSFALPEEYNRQVVLDNVNLQRIGNNPRVFTDNDLNSILEQFEQASSFDFHRTEG